MSEFFKHKEGRLLVNMGGNFVFQGIYMLLAFWYSPYLLKQLGPSLFGLVPLITSLTAYLAIISTSIDSSVGRSLSMAIKKDRRAEATGIVNTAFKVYFLITVLFLVCGFFIMVNLDGIIKLPRGFEGDAKWLCLAVFCTFCLTTLSAPFKSTLFSHNLVFINKLIQVVAYSLSIGIVVSWFYFIGPSLLGVAIGNVVGGVVTALFSITVACFLMPYFRFSVRQYDSEVAKGIMAIGGWLIVNLIGSLLYLKIDLLVVNRLFGPVSTGMYAIVLQISTLLRTFSGQIISAFTPSFMYRMSENDIKGLFEYSRFCLRLLGVVMVLLIGGMCGFGDVFLTLWVGDEYAGLHGLLCVAVFHLCVNISVTPLFSVQIATGNVRVPGIMTLMLGGVNLGLALFLAGYMDWGLYGVAAAGAIALTAKNALFTPIYNAKLLGQRWYVFIQDIAVVVCATFLVATGSFSLNRLLKIEHWIQLIGIGLTIAIIYFPFAWKFMMSDGDRTRLRNSKMKLELFGFGKRKSGL